MRSPWIVALPVAGLLYCSVPATAMEQQPGITSQSQIEQALQEKPKTRGLRLRATSEEGKAEHALVSESPGESPGESKIDLNIPFEYNSSTLQPQAVAQLEQLRSALFAAALADSRFLVAGHTDAKGRADYNQQLSLQRADAVKAYLIARGVDAARLKSAGEGETHLLTPDDPDNAVNRRVEIRNLGGSR
jgi:OmpA-OmpF porin, OOP family